MRSQHAAAELDLDVVALESAGQAAVEQVGEQRTATRPFIALQ